MLVHLDRLVPYQGAARDERVWELEKIFANAVKDLS
jgi:hypothetical protein